MKSAEIADRTPGESREVLKEIGFGILTVIYLQSTMKKKLEKDYPSFLILVACNPDFANRVLCAEPQVSILLPCNIST